VSSLPDDLSFERCISDDIFHFGKLFFKMLHNKGKVESDVEVLRAFSFNLIFRCCLRKERWGAPRFSGR